MGSLKLLVSLKSSKVCNFTTILILVIIIATEVKVGNEIYRSVKINHYWLLVGDLDFRDY